MGNTVSTPDFFLLAQLPPEKFTQLLAEEMTVIRTSGEKQNGWRIPSVSHSCNQGRWVAHHAEVWDNMARGHGDKTWSFHMVRDGPGVHCCGWRLQRTFWPTRLTTEEEKETWWAELDALIATLKRTREMSDAEWVPLYEAQKEREAEVERTWSENQKEMAFQNRRDEALALDPEMGNRYTFWKEFDAERTLLMEQLKQLRQEAGNNPELEEDLTAFTTLYGDEQELGDKLKARMLQEKAENKRQATLRERERLWQELDALEQNAVAHKDYCAAGRAQAQKVTAQQSWAEEDANA
jgi:hypothetical protein